MQRQLYILKKHTDLLTARHLALQEYEKLFQKFYTHISNSTHTILRERYALEGKMAYLIRVGFTEDTSLSDYADMEDWAAEHITSDPTNTL